MAQIGKAEARRKMTMEGWLPLVPPAFRTEVLRGSMLMRFSPGQPIFQVGDPVGGIYGLVAGTVSVSIAAAGSTPRLVMLGVPGHWTGEGCFLTRTPRRGELRAVTETTMLYLPLEVMDQLAQRGAKVADHVALILMMTVELLFRVVHDLQKPEAHRRIASVLQRTIWSENVCVPLTQIELGVMANASRKQVNAALKKFSDEGWVKNSYRSVTIIDPKALGRFADREDGD